VVVRYAFVVISWVSIIEIGNAKNKEECQTKCNEKNMQFHGCFDHYLNIYDTVLISLFDCSGSSG
jgi:hypothetical protein